MKIIDIHTHIYPDDIARKATDSVREFYGIGDGSIVLMHDIYKTTVEAAKEMVLRLKKQGYTFVTTSELIEARRGGIVPGKQYS